MLLRIDRVMLRVPNVPAAVKYYCDLLGLKLIKEQKGLAALRFAQGEGEMVLHDDPDLPAGEISLFSAILLCVLSAAGLIAASYFLNPLCFYLSPIALIAVCFYSLTKRFTDYTHVFLGLCRHAAVIDECINRNSCSNIGDAAVMVGMKMGDQEVIDLLYPRILRRSQNAVRVPAFV